MSGKEAVSVNWGPWSSKGMAAATSRRNSTNGIGNIAPDQGIKVLEEILQYDITQIAVLPIRWKSFAKQFTEKTPPLYQNFIKSGTEQLEEKEKPALIVHLEETEPEKRKDILLDFLQSQTMRVLGTDSEGSIDVSQPLQTMGIDSLMAIELKNSIDKNIGKKLPATIVFNYPTIDALATFLLTDVLELDKPQEKTVEEEKTAPRENKHMEKVISEVENMSDEEAEALLMKKLEEDDEDLD